MAAGAGTGRAETLWRFAVRLYGEPGISDLCLELQDRHGVDVPLLLWAAWVGVASGHALSTDELAAAEGAVRLWRRDVVAPLRAVRRRLKQGPLPIAPTAGSAALRDRLKTIELEAERLQLDALARHPVATTGSADAGGALEVNLALLLPSDLPKAFTSGLHEAALSAWAAVLASD